MSDFHKKFVRVEWLAFQKAVDLIREAEFDDSYFVGRSQLVCDEGLALTIADAGRALYDGEGKFVKDEELGASDLGLEGEIGQFFQESESLERDSGLFFLKRTYLFHVFRKGEKDSNVTVAVAFAKLTRDDDWKLVHECVTDQHRDGDNRWMIYRTKDLESKENFKTRI